MGRREFEDVDDLGEILFCDDPALRIEGALMGLDTAEGAVTLPRARTRHMPVALFDYRVAIGAGGSFPYAAERTAPVDDALQEPRLGVARSFGMTRLTPEFGDLRLPDALLSGDYVLDLARRMEGPADLCSVPGWELHELPDDGPGPWTNTADTYSRLELRTPDGALYSRTWVPYDPEWQDAARSHGHVVCLCGVELGIRAPYAMTAAQYTARMRHAHFRRACVAGLAVGGLVAYTDHR